MMLRFTIRVILMLLMVSILSVAIAHTGTTGAAKGSVMFLVGFVLGCWAIWPYHDWLIETMIDRIK